jgi:large subunit ribosomal protein L3
VSAIVGKKLGMTRVFTEDGASVPVTVIEALPNKVTGIRRADRDGYEAVQLAADPVTPEDKLTKAELGHLKKAGAPAMRTLVEFRDAEDAPSGGEAVKVGDEVTVTSFEPGQRVKVSAVSIGKGFQGTIKRHNFSRGPVSTSSRWTPSATCS